MKLIKISKIIYLAILIAILSTGCSSGNGGGGDPQNNNYTVSGNSGKGSVIEGKVEFFNEDNLSIGSTEVFGEDGSYSISDLNYVGKIKAVLTIKEYHDETLNKNITIDNLKLSAISYIEKTNNTINITPLTDVAVSILGNNALAQTKEKIQSINEYVAKAVGITNDNYNPAKGLIKFTNKDDGILENTSSNRHSFALLAISNDSNLSDSESDENRKTKVEASINKFYKALVEASNDKTKLENIIENTTNITTRIKDINNSDLIDHSKNIEIAQEYIKDTAVGSYIKILHYFEDNNSEQPDVQDYINIGMKGVTSENIDNINKDINVTNGFESIEKVVKHDVALSKIVTFVDNNTSIAPTVQDYIDLGITNVNNDNLTMINIQLSKLSSSDLNTIEKIKSIIVTIINKASDAMDKIIKYIYLISR
jgi:hypothetical protein